MINSSILKIQDSKFGIKKFSPKRFFSRKSNKNNDNPPQIKSSKVKNFLSKLSGSFFIVIALMPFAGLLLGIGSAILSGIPVHTTTGQIIAYSFGEILNQIGSSLFSNLGLFFAVAIVMGFTKDWRSGLTSIWAYFVFNAFQNALLDTFAHNINTSDPASTFVFWFYRSVPVSIIDSNVGFMSMNSSVIGGILIGGIVVWSWKRFSEFELPSVLSFFNGSRFVPFVVTLAVMPLGILYLLLWPIIGIGLVTLGNSLGNLNGWQFFIVSLIWRWLTPFGVHHAFYTVFWFTPIGGSLSGDDLIYIGANHSSKYSSFVTGPLNQYVTISNWLIANGKQATNISYPQGDNGVWFFMEKNGIPFDSFIFSPGTSPDNLGKRLVANTGLYLAPNFPTFIGGATGSILAMIHCAPKKDRKKVIAVMGSALITSFAIGVTEPWLWSYILIAPFLFFGFNAIMTALGSYAMAVLPTASGFGPISGTRIPISGTEVSSAKYEILQAHQHVGTAFSTGLLDYIIYGLIPISNGTNPYWVLPLSAVFCVLYYIMFTFWIRFRKIQIPAIDASGEVLEVKKDAARTQRNTNIVTMFNCATRVRVDVKNPSLVNEAILKSSGAVKTLILGNNIQVIYGVKAETIAQKANKFLKSNPKFGDDFKK